PSLEYDAVTPATSTQLLAPASPITFSTFSSAVSHSTTSNEPSFVSATHEPSTGPASASAKAPHPARATTVVAARASAISLRNTRYLPSSPTRGCARSGSASVGGQPIPSPR